MLRALCLALVATGCTAWSGGHLRCTHANACLAPRPAAALPAAVPRPLLRHRHVQDARLQSRGGCALMSEKTAETAVTPADEAAFEEEVQQVRPALSHHAAAAV